MFKLYILENGNLLENIWSKVHFPPCFFFDKIYDYQIIYEWGSKHPVTCEVFYCNINI